MSALRVQHGPPPHDALPRFLPRQGGEDSEPILKSAEISVQTFKGALQLSGFVDSQADINNAASLTRALSGAKSVKDDMRSK